jgi:hypothetical protein
MPMSLEKSPRRLSNIECYGKVGGAAGRGRQNSLQRQVMRQNVGERVMIHFDRDWRQDLVF